MNFIQTKPVLLAICLVCGLFGCKEEILIPDLEGSLVGYVYTFDEYANLLEDHSGVQVTAHGPDFIAGTRTDASGRFEFRHLPAGTYELQMEKDGFGTMKQFGIQHLGGKPTVLGLSFSETEESRAIFLYQASTTQINSLLVVNDTIYGDFNFSGDPPEYISLRLYFSDEPGFATPDADEVLNRTFWKRDDGIYKYPLMSVYFLPYGAGDTVYFRARIFTEAYLYYLNRMINGIDTYIDLESNQTIYPNIGNESAQFSFIFPE